MAGPFKMKGSPMQRNFGIGSPLHQNLQKEGKQLEKKFIGPIKPMVDKDNDGIPVGIDVKDTPGGKQSNPPEKKLDVKKSQPNVKNSQPNKPPTMPKSHPVTPPSNNNKKKKGTWFGLKDRGITEFRDKIVDKYMPKW
jgi:hypothetical protein